MKSQHTRLGYAVVLSILLLGTGPALAQTVVPNGISAANPNGAPAGTTGLTVQFTLNAGAQPAPPPEQVPINSVRIGAIEGQSPSRTGDVVSAVFNIPAGEPAGAKDVEVEFPAPPQVGGTLIFRGAGLFAVATSGDTPTPGATATPTSTGGPSGEAYYLYAPLGSTQTTLMDRDRQTVHTWSSTYRPGNAVYLLPDGDLLRTGNTNNPSFGAGGAGGIVERLDANSTVTWSYTYSDTQVCQHHDIEPLPNGNILMIAWEKKSPSEAIAAGRDPSLITEGEVWIDTILEVEPTGATTGTIVWKWGAWDHLVQDHDAGQPNYGTVADHPALIDFNYVGSGPSAGAADWLHINAVHYNHELNQIVVSVHTFGEIWIIDHDTTTQQAAGPAGDLLYRWGNPQAYGAPGDQQLFVQHDSRWIADNHPGGGNILVFNNGGGRPGGDSSSVDEIVPPLQPDGTYSLTPGTAYEPAAPTWTYQASTPTDFYARNISGAHRLPNGDTLVTDGPAGRFFEVDTAGNTVWEHAVTGAQLFRVTRYEADYPGLPFDVDTSTPTPSAQPPTATPTAFNPTATPTGPTATPADPGELTYPIVDTFQDECFNNSTAIACPQTAQDFHGQDAHYDGHQPSYTVSGDGLTVYDNVTGLTWMRTSDLNNDGDINADDKRTFAEFLALPDTLNNHNYGGFDDWRPPTIKELYSLIDFRGLDPAVESTSTNLTPFIDGSVFDWGHGDLDAGQRIIDGQVWSNTVYVSTTMGGFETRFGVNFVDGRIKGYGNPPNNEMEQYVRLVRGNPAYGHNNFVDNGDGTVTDLATGLQWQQADNGTGVNWKDALAYAEGLELASKTDWRLPNAKELQSIVDYTRSPDTSSSPSIDPAFSCTQITNEAGNPDYGFYWTGTTHKRFNGVHANAAYVCFGRGLGSMDGTTVIDVHGAGCQRSDPKDGDPNDYPSWGFGPQGDMQRVFNFVRCVRDADFANAPDTDGDGIPDSAEGINSALPAGKSNVWLVDSDSDGLMDGEEDFDADGTQDADETATRNADTDGDQYGDGIEQLLGMDPLVADPGFADGDGDRLPDAQDAYNGKDQDGDRYADGHEAAWFQSLAAANDAQLFPPLGDGNGDGMISNLDALLAQSIFLESVSIESPAYDGPLHQDGFRFMDGNGDGSVSNVDALLMQSFFLLLTDVLPL